MKGEFTESGQHQHQQQHHQQQDMFSSSSKLQHQHQIQPYSPSSASKGDGATIEVSRRPRGRPPGSKNKPKPPLIITRESPPSMSPFILEISPGSDVISAIHSFCKRRRTALSLLAASGSVANVTLRQPAATPAATVTFHGRFDLLSLSATVFPEASPVIAGGFGITLAGPQGQVVGGSVVGPLVAAATVFVVAAAFDNPEYHRLSGDEEGGGREGNGDDVAVERDGGDGDTSMYQMEATGEGVWAPTARQAPQGHYQ